MSAPTSDVPAPRPTMPRALAAGVALVVVGLGCWLLYLTSSGGSAQHSYNRGGRPAAYVRLVSGHAYSIAVHGGVNRELRLGLDPGTLHCTLAQQGQAPGALTIVAEDTQTKATNKIASFVSTVTGVAQVRCSGIGAVYVDDAADAAYDWSGLWLVLSVLALVVGIPLALSGLRAGPQLSAVGSTGEHDQVE